jgi:hypothetical protein
MFDRFQIVLAHYVFCLLNHGGQTCPLYARMCRISRYFKPGMRPENLRSEGNEIALSIYENLCEKHGIAFDM